MKENVIKDISQIKDGPEASINEKSATLSDFLTQQLASKDTMSAERVKEIVASVDHKLSSLQGSVQELRFQDKLAEDVKMIVDKEANDLKPAIVARDDIWYVLTTKSIFCVNVSWTSSHLRTL